MTAPRVLLGRVVDYAGLFPPAGLSMERAVESYAEYAAGRHAWMLGNFVVPVARLSEFVGAWKELPKAARRELFRLSLLVGSDVDAELATARTFMDSSPNLIQVRSLEIKAATPDAVRAVGMSVEALPEVSVVFVEVPADNPGPSVAVIGAIGLCAKLRTGGVTADAFPRASQVIAFMRECLSVGAPFKATAGLHHPVCATYPLTYADNAPSGPMFGFLNVFLAACILMLHGSDDDATALLQDTDPAAFTFSPTAVAWRGVRMSTSALQLLRVRGAASFGSCSFTEPVADLERMGVSL